MLEIALVIVLTFLEIKSEKKAFGLVSLLNNCKYNFGISLIDFDDGTFFSTNSLIKFILSFLD